MKLSIVIPAYNEEKTISQVISKVAALNVKKEIIVVNDASTDKTAPILESLSAKFLLKVFHHDTNQGKGAAVKTGVKVAKGEYVVIQDADLEYQPQQILKLLKSAEKNNWPVVYGSRFLGSCQKMTWQFWLGNRLLTLLTNFLFKVKLTDMETCYKLFKRELIQSLDWQAKRFDFEPEITVRILKKGIKIREIPIDYVARKKSEGKKISFRDGLEAAALLFDLKKSL
ncbi:glycosyltransferase family 2 protein [Patescibacteria group bacterium]